MGRAALTVAAALLTLGGVVLLVQGAVPCEVLASQPDCDVAIHPGPSEPTLPLVTIEGAEVHPPDDGELRMATIAVVEDLGWWEWVTSRASEVIEVVRREAIFPETDPEDSAERNAAAMAESQLVATVAALRHLGYELPGEGAEVVGHAADTVADDVEVGEVITAVDGVTVAESRDVVELIATSQPGDTVTLTLARQGSAPRDVHVVVGESPTEAGAPYLGLFLTTELELPVDVEIDAGVVGGPSAGMVFALTIVELLGPEDLADGRVVAGTGTIDADGHVGAIGGVAQKLAGVTAATDAAAEVFLVPRDNLEQARRATVGSDILLVPIDDLDDAVDALQRLADGRSPQEAELLAAG